MGKRANHEGSIFQRKDGRWSGSLQLGVDKNGRRKRQYVYGRSQAEAREKLDALKEQHKSRSTATYATDSVAGYLHRWLRDDIAVNNAAKTFEEYESSTRLHSIPFIGHIKLTRLDGEKLKEWQATLKRNGFSENQRLRSIRVLRNALNQAIKLGLISSNPCQALKIPKVERREVIPLEPEQCHQLFAECESHRVGDIIILAAMTGLRKRELFALEWSAVNLSEGVLTVRKALEEVKGKISVKPPKTRSGRRVVTLDSIAVEALRRRLRKAHDEGFGPDEVPICFPDTVGGYLRGSNFDRQCWYPIREAAEIPPSVRFHDMRHTQASLMLHAGVDMKVIQKRLGHADYSTTANTYSHLLQDAQAKATERLSALMAVTPGCQPALNGSADVGKS